MSPLAVAVVIPLLALFRKVLLLLRLVAPHMFESVAMTGQGLRLMRPICTYTSTHHLRTAHHVGQSKPFSDLGPRLTASVTHWC